MKNASTEKIQQQTKELQVLTSGDKVKEEEVKKVADYFEELSETSKTQKKTVNFKFSYSVD